ncbi:MAG: hypothetical protein E7389_00800 [Ruminococcaceae bacterium]|nr:hypothetical protein [Oscillospiraceae bacterium]
MKKNPIGFDTETNEKTTTPETVAPQIRPTLPKKSVVQVYFPSRGTGWSYYNDSFDLKVGDLVYVEGKLAGKRGFVTDVNYSFKIKLSDYKKVIAVADTNVKGDFYFANSYFVTFDRNALPPEKILSWFKAPETETEYVCGDYDGDFFPLEEPDKMNISHEKANKGFELYANGNVIYLCIDGSKGVAVIEGTDTYEMEFDYINGEIGNIKCSCFCGYTCKHEFAAVLQLRETVNFINENYRDMFNGFFASVRKETLLNTSLNNKKIGKISFGG